MFLVVSVGDRKVVHPPLFQELVPNNIFQDFSPILEHYAKKGFKMFM
jgi:hypothetical protein